MVGDATLYTRQDMVEASWAVVEPIMQVWDTHNFDFPNYAAGPGPQGRGRNAGAPRAQLEKT